MLYICCIRCPCLHKLKHSHFHFAAVTTGMLLLGRRARATCCCWRSPPSSLLLKSSDRIALAPATARMCPWSASAPEAAPSRADSNPPVILCSINGCMSLDATLLQRRYSLSIALSPGPAGNHWPTGSSRLDESGNCCAKAMCAAVTTQRISV